MIVDPLRIEWRLTPNQERGRSGHRPRAVVVHTTEGTFAGTVAWFADTSSRVSAHYLVGLDGRVAQFVDESDTARHAGRVNQPVARFLTDESPNLYTVGIEFEDGGDAIGVRRPAAQYRSGAKLLRAIAERWGIPLDRRHVVGHREIYALKACPGNLDIERLIAEAREASPAWLVCLLPVRNGAGDLPGYLTSVGRFADAVVALDDGSTDETRQLLDASPLVKVLVTNPPRTGYGGWDDGDNRNRLLEAAGQLRPGWIVSLDVDERLDAEDAQALRAFVEHDAVPGCAFGFQHFRIWGRGHDPRFSYVYRLFASRPGQAFPRRRLHFDPVPTSIPRHAWLRTTIRVRHLGAATEVRRLARLAKYREADPDGRFPTNFGNLAEPVDCELPGWPRRPADLPTLLPWRAVS